MSNTFLGLSPLLFLNKETYKELMRTMAVCGLVLARISNEYGLNFSAGLNSSQDIETSPVDESVLEMVERIDVTGYTIVIDSNFAPFREIECTTMQDGVQLLDGMLRPIKDIVKHVVDESRGQYMYQHFATLYEKELRDQIECEPEHESPLDILLEGPEHDWYYEAWEEIENEHYTITDEDGIKWNIHTNGGIYLIRADLSELESDYLPLLQ